MTTEGANDALVTFFCVLGLFTALMISMEVWVGREDK